MTEHPVFVTMVRGICSKTCRFPNCSCPTMPDFITPIGRARRALRAAAMMGWKMTPDIATAEMKAALETEITENALIREVWKAGFDAAPDILGDKP